MHPERLRQPFINFKSMGLKYSSKGRLFGDFKNICNISQKIEGSARREEGCQFSLLWPTNEKAVKPGLQLPSDEFTTTTGRLCDHRRDSRAS